VFVSITFNNQSESFFRVHSALFLALWFENIQITKASQEQFGEDKKLPEVPRFDSMIFKPAIFNLSKAGRLKPQLHKHAPAFAGFRTLNLLSVCVGGLRLFSREFHSPGLGI